MSGLISTIQSFLAASGAEPMLWDSFPWLSLITFGPLAGIAALAAIPRGQKSMLRNVAALTSLVVFFLSIGLLVYFDPNIVAAQGQAFTFQLTEGPYEWIPSIGISYFMGVDGISLWLVLLTTFLMPIAIVSTYSSVDTYVKEYMMLLLFLEVGMVGALVSLDVFLFYIFWEMMLIPMYFIIGIWGSHDRILASVKFFLYTMVGSLLMLVGILYVYFQTGGSGGEYSFLFTDMVSVSLGYQEQLYLMGAFFLAFAIKVPLFPFHTWLPLAHVQAPTAGSVILAGILLKMGTYGMLRYAFPMFPDALKTFAPYAAILAVIGIIYGALVAMVQDNVKSLVAYSSISHLGFCVLGLLAMTPEGLSGGLYVMVAHGVATGGLFLCVGILYERRHTKRISEFGGIAKSMPVFAGAFGVLVFASAGLPGLNGFVGEFLSLVGTAKSQFLWFSDALVFTPPVDGSGTNAVWEFGAASEFPMPSHQQAGPEMTAYVFALLGATGVIWAAAYLLWMFRRVMFGPLDKEENRELDDLNTRETLYLVPVVLMSVLMGVFPNFFLSRMQPSVDQFLDHMQQEVTATGTVVADNSSSEDES